MQLDVHFRHWESEATAGPNYRKRGFFSDRLACVQGSVLADFRIIQASIALLVRNRRSMPLVTLLQTEDMQVFSFD